MPPAFTEKDIPRIIEQLRLSGGIKTVAAQRLNVHRKTLHRFLEDHPEVTEALRDIDAEIADVAEAQVVKAINAGDMQTVRWFLELKAKDRGYVRRVENVGKNGGPMEVVEKTDLSAYTDEEVAIMAAAARRRKESQASNQG
ncbi:regulatory Fis family protein [Pseudaminobacter salicylatoxidans]|uniref:Regulatory Fis family protein n=1 Tax=Pseudaminobacter salicylatoxidans TaxID=93369 RepID=A0A316C0G8_PSESE|nr:helix-turn-helix domain-containing protein [Pseudaminobacter salicylatoxidans]PWJ81506.1 regulatory Fis family protein [Pseudaminobacter salicylatoxidans]